MLGCTCAICGADQELEFDHMRGRTYSLRKLSQDQRIIKLRREIPRAEIRLLCRFHNAQDGSRRRWRGPAV